MWILLAVLAGEAVWLELVYHFSGFGWASLCPVPGLFLIMAWTGLWSAVICLFKNKPQKILYYIALWLPVVWAGAQLVYLRIFKQPLLWEAVIYQGNDALTTYWREALAGIAGALPFLLLMALPAAILPIILKKRQWTLPQCSLRRTLPLLAVILAGIAGSAASLLIGSAAGQEYADELTEFYDPLAVAEDMGVLATLHGDTALRLRSLAADMTQGTVTQASGYVPAVSADTAAPAAASRNGLQAQAVPAGEGTAQADTQEGAAQSGADAAPSGTDAGTDAGAGSGADTETDADEPETPQIVPHQFDIDYALLHELADNDHQTWLADYIEGQTPTDSNEYTGIFEGYNLIFLTAEGFSTYAIDEELTPTLYRLSHSGFVFNNYYVPIWQTSTSDGEYVNMTGLIPDQQFSMRKSAANVQPFVMPAFFAADGVKSYAYHDNSLSYYERQNTHPNMGYDFRASLLGNLNEAEWGSHVFEMENPGQWPASDYNMMKATVPEYVHGERFHVYYMTVSGHMNYNFKGNAMSAKNKEAVADLELSEGPRAYIACNIELDKALENLLEQLEDAGQLEKTVICLSADHYPYGLTDEQYTELAGRDLSQGKDLFRNTLILWNAGMEDEPVYVDKACCSIDLLPTLLNLFGFPFDSRMYAGRDIFSDREGMVIFNNRDFLTDSVIFIEKGDITTWLQDENGSDIIPDADKEAYLEAMRAEVKQRYTFSAYILQENYYSDVLQAMREPDAG